METIVLIQLQTQAYRSHRCSIVDHRSLALLEGVRGGEKATGAGLKNQDKVPPRCSSCKNLSDYASNRTRPRDWNSHLYGIVRIYAVVCICAGAIFTLFRG